MTKIYTPLRYSDFVAPLVKAVQELSNKNDELSRQNDELKTRFERLEQLVLQGSNVKSAISLSDARIEQNVPNPFNSNTLINYYIPENMGRSAIRINDMNGKLLKSFTVSTHGSGQIAIKANELSKGTYQYSLVVNGKIVDSKKMTIQ